MPWADFDLASALERDLLCRALPLVPTVSDGSSRATVDLAANTANVHVSVVDAIGATPTNCVDLLRIRPLLVGAAWKVLDLLLETALEEAGLQPDLPRGWSIKGKVAHAKALDGRPAQASAQAWTALMKTYAGTVELRHSLVHRRAHTDASNALVGVDDAGARLRPLSASEQEALVRAALRAAQLVAAAHPDGRVEADLLRQLGALTGVHGERLPAVSLLDSLPEITVVVDPKHGAPDRYLLDVPALKARQPFRGATHADLVVGFRDRPGRDARGRLEDAPDEVIVIDPDSPPGWLS